MLKIGPAHFKPTVLVKVIAIALLSAAGSLVLMWGAIFVDYMALKMAIPEKWVVFLIVSFVFTLVIGPIKECN